MTERDHCNNKQGTENHVLFPKENDSRESKKDRSAINDEFVSNVTLHGLRYVYQEKGLRKLVWFFMFFSAIALSFLLFYGIAADFFEHKSYLTIYDFDYRKNHLDLPTITVCPKVPLIHEGYERVSKMINLTEQQFEDFYLKFLTRFKFGSPGVTPFEAEVINALKRHNVTTVLDAMKTFEINHDDLLHDPLSKLFLATREGDPHYPTTRSDFSRKLGTKETYSSKEGVCHQLNHFEADKEPLKAWDYESGHFGNLVAVLNLHASESIKRHRMVRIEAPYMDLTEGVVLYVHPYGTPHSIYENYKRVLLEPGKWHVISVDYTQQHLLPHPYITNCGTRPYKRMSSEHHLYSKAMCIEDCVLDMQYKKCGCIGWEHGDHVDLPLCNITEIKCFLQSRGESMHECRHRGADMCPDECLKSRYSVTVNSLDLRDDVILDKAVKVHGHEMNRSEIGKIIKKNIVGLQFEYNSNTKVERMVPSVTWSTLLGTIGGSIGLTMGFSIITACELIFFIIDYCMTPKKEKQKAEAV